MFKLGQVGLCFNLNTNTYHNILYFPPPKKKLHNEHIIQNKKINFKYIQKEII